MKVRSRLTNSETKNNEYLSISGDNQLNEKQKNKKRVSKNKKKNWRKHIDIEEIEDALEGERLEERTTGKLSEKQNKELFFIDAKADANNQSLSKREQLRNKRLHIDITIEPNPDQIVPSKHIGLVKLRKKEKAKLRRQDVRNKQIQKKSFIKEENLDAPDSVYDLWAVDNVKDKIFKTKDADIQRDTVIGKRQVKRPQHLNKKPNESKKHAAHDCPTVEVSHPGASYNPTLKDHQDLLRKAHVVEENKVNEEEKVKKALHVPFENLLEEGERNMEEQEGLFEQSDDSGSEHSEANELEPAVIVNPPVRATDRKTRRRRRLEQAEKLRKLEKHSAVAHNLREHEVFRTKTFLAEIKQKNKQIEEKKKIRDSRTKLPRLSKYKYQEPDLEIKLSSEMKGSLRELAPEGGIMLDRYKSLQKRGVIEPRVKSNKPKRKYKIKYKEKRAYREITL